MESLDGIAGIRRYLLLKEGNTGKCRLLHRTRDRWNPWNANTKQGLEWKVSEFTGVGSTVNYRKKIEKIILWEIA